ncbi:ABC transporter ATP-binding protein [Rossellomorea vietnamensis]|uniref:ABC transporter ATP-binding protein n=1 Tax=Rossellomorea vietnamensis TaxID=218284 RepID=A0A5D4NWM1_9BACI|nr:ABC transporter ATP-binding protein [Rossellomorea vietnamensis]TYS18111.1 ABC transporter ATP-binding protein [Rossellomorea vietnamensis]
MIQLHKISKQFEGKESVHDVSLSIKKGSVYGLLGSNGAGKTTLLKILAGIYKPESGEVKIFGQQVFESPEIKQKIFFLADTPGFFPQYTLKQMASFYRAIYKNWDEERFLELCMGLGIDTRIKLHKFSKGVQRQAAFLIALSCRPDLLIMDEPVDGLDPVVRKKIKSILMEEAAYREMTILISSHNLEEIEDLCDHVGILHQGRMLIQKELDELKSVFHKIQVAFRGDTPQEMVDKLHVLQREKRGSVLSFIVKGAEQEIEEVVTSFQPVIFDILPLTLEEIFIHEMGDAGYALKNILVK